MSERLIAVKPYGREQRLGIDVQIIDDEATVQDYYQALDEYILSGTFIRTRANANSCEGCPICCQERIPLTSIDVLTLKKAMAPEQSLNKFLSRYGYVSVEGPVVDIALGRDEAERCLLLDPVIGKCRNYQARPLVCHTYICTILSPRARKLREALINSGMDELVRLMLAEGQGKFPVHEAYEPAVNCEDWPENAWSGVEEYSRLKLKDILPDKLWSELKKGESSV